MLDKKTMASGDQMSVLRYEVCKQLGEVEGTEEGFERQRPIPRLCAP
jgi:hypothetical protein